MDAENQMLRGDWFTNERQPAEQDDDRELPITSAPVVSALINAAADRAVAADRERQRIQHAAAIRRADHQLARMFGPSSYYRSNT